MSKKSIILLGKGASVDKCTKEFVDSHDSVASCNIHRWDLFEDKISNRCDILFVREKETYEDMNPKLKEIFNGFDIKEIYATGSTSKDKFNKFLNFNVNGNIFKRINGHSPSTGILALENLCLSKKYNSITIVGLDLFKVGESLYYFDIDLLEHKPLNKAYKNEHLTNDGKLNKIMGHTPENETNMMSKLISLNKNIRFKIMSINEDLKNELSKYTNVEVL